VREKNVRKNKQKNEREKKQKENMLGKNCQKDSKKQAALKKYKKKHCL
jgi:hypothetical protein